MRETINVEIEKKREAIRSAIDEFKATVEKSRQELKLVFQGQ
jgi:hypothetical protein